MHVSLADFYPIADGETLDTHCFQRALNHLATRGGGTLSVPPGRYHLGTLTLGSNINLHLEAGATLLASSRVEDYQQQLAQSQAELSQHVLLYAVGQRNISISGKGVIDGNGDTWFAAEKDE